MKPLLARPLFVVLSLLLSPLSASTRPSPVEADQVHAAALQLAHLMRSLVDREEFVGAELYVLHHGKPIAHEVAGWKDREANAPMERGTYFAVRSMTKPFTGMAAQLLIDEGKLELDAPVARYLPSFDVRQSREITIRQLLTHRSGLPLNAVGGSGKVLGDFANLRELADLSGATGPEFVPGSRFLYSDAGSDALAAVIAEVSGQSFEAFLQERILDPLGFGETFPEASAGRPEHRERTATRYTGHSGSWTRYWGPADPPLYPFLKGSGGLFCTPHDYAEFLRFWLNRQTREGKVILSSDAFERALQPVSRDVNTTGLSGAAIDYGQMWMLPRPRSGETGHFGFGHTGSDGTLAYAFPELDLIVCCFTQSRGTTGLRTVEEALSHLFLAPNPPAFTELIRDAKEPGDEFLGLYSRDQRSNSVGAIVKIKGRMAFELANRQVMFLRATDDPDRWVPERAPNDAITFTREQGRVVGFTLEQGDRRVEARRFQPDPSLPTVEELAALRQRAAPAELVAALLPLRVQGTGGAAGQTFAVTMTLDQQRRAHMVIDFGAAGQMHTWCDGERAWRQLPEQSEPVELEGLERAEELSGSLAALLGDWRDVFADIRVLGRESHQGAEVLRVRLTPRDGLAVTKLVAVGTGQVLVDYAISAPPGAGFVPTETRHSDYREIEGVAIAHAQTVLLPGGSANAVRVVITAVEPRAANATARRPITQPAKVAQP